MQLVWLAILFPLIGALVNGLFGRVIKSKLVSGIIGCTALGLSFATAIWVWLDYFQQQSSLVSPYVEVVLWPWIHVGVLRLDAALLVDPLSITMMLFITGISFLIHIYSTGYMSHDRDYSRFFTYLNLFVAMMLVLVLGSSLVTMFVGWEGVGLCSYLLIGFWYKDMYNANCGMKAFVVNRIGDFGVLIGIFMVFSVFGALDFVTIFNTFPDKLATAGNLIPLAIALFLFLGATGKSAQWPLHIWLPDAMAGPTPVSALIHAATMVTAGVYMVARMNPVFAFNEMAGLIVAVVGAFTAFMAATIAMTQNDIKKVLAYSTVSQLGYMFLACGVGAYWVAIFHVVTHAFFKACLFLGSGSVIHGMHEEQDTRHMGGLAKYMPLTYWTFVISTFAIAGIIPLAGFFSKDEILWKVATWDGMFPWVSPVIWGLALITAFMTAFYMGRVTWKTFLGKPRWTNEFTEKHKHPHESGPSMTMPLVVLAIGAVFGGMVLFTPAWLGGNENLPAWLGPSTEQFQSIEAIRTGHDIDLIGAQAGHDTGHGDPGMHGETLEDTGHGEGHGAEPFIMVGSHTATEIAFAAVSVLLALIALIWSHRVFVAKFGTTEKWKKQFAWLHAFSLNKWFIDEAYHYSIVIPGVAFSYVCWRIFDLKIIDGIVNGTAWVIGAMGQIVRPLQTGFVRNYALYILLGVVIFLLLNLFK